MIAVAVVLAFFIAGLAAYMVSRPDPMPSKPDLDPEAAMKAAIELHRIRSNLDVALTRSEIRRDAAQTIREIREALNDDRP